MAKKQNKKYSMRPISSKFSEKGGFSARFEGDGYSVDAFEEILPDVIDKNGIKVSQGVARDLIGKFLQACAIKTASTGENVSVEGHLMFQLSIRGWYANKDSKATRDNVHVGVRLLDELKPTVEFSMTNVNDGATLTLYTVRGAGEDLGVVANGASATINGKYLKLLGGDKVTAACGEETRELTVLESADDHVTVAIPSDFASAAKDGAEVVFTVEGRCGDPEAGTQTKPITATLRQTAEPGPKVVNVQDADTSIHPFVLTSYQSFTVTGERLANAQVTLKYHSKSRNEDMSPTADVSDNTDTGFTAVIPASDTKMDAENARLVVKTDKGTIEVPVEFVG